MLLAVNCNILTGLHLSAAAIDAAGRTERLVRGTRSGGVCSVRLLRRLTAALLAWSCLAGGAAHAQTWLVVTDTDPITGDRYAGASVATKGASAGWRLIASCDQRGDSEPLWSLRIHTRDDIRVYNDHTDVVLQFDRQEPATIRAGWSGNDSSAAVLLESDRSSTEQLMALIAELKTSNSLTIQIAATKRVFSLDGSSKALSTWINHCGLT